MRGFVLVFNYPESQVIDGKTKNLRLQRKITYTFHVHIADENFLTTFPWGYLLYPLKQ